MMVKPNGVPFFYMVSRMSMSKFFFSFFLSFLAFTCFDQARTIMNGLLVKQEKEGGGKTLERRKKNLR